MCLSGQETKVQSPSTCGSGLIITFGVNIPGGLSEIQTLTQILNPDLWSGTLGAWGAALGGTCLQMFQGAKTAFSSWIIGVNFCV